MKRKYGIALIPLLTLLTLTSCPHANESFWRPQRAYQILVEGTFVSDDRSASLTLRPISEETFLYEKGINTIVDQNSKWSLKYYAIDFSLCINGEKCKIDFIDLHPDFYPSSFPGYFGYVDYHNYQIVSMMDDADHPSFGYLVAIDGIQYSLKG